MGLSVLQNCTLPQNRASIQSLDFMSWFVFRHALSTIGPYIDKCVVFQSMSSQLNLSQVDSTKVGETSGCWSVENRCAWAQFWVSWQKLWIHVHVIFLFLFLINFKLTFFTLCGSLRWIKPVTWQNVKKRSSVSTSQMLCPSDLSHLVKTDTWKCVRTGW